MEKDFERWNICKQRLDAGAKDLNFHEREVWWCSIGVNIGTEQHSQTNDFSRPILVVKRFTEHMFWGIPLTTKIKESNFRFRFVLEDIENDLLIFQMRAYDRKRLKRKIAVMPKDDFSRLITLMKSYF